MIIIYVDGVSIAGILCHLAVAYYHVLPSFLHTVAYVLF